MRQREQRPRNRLLMAESLEVRNLLAGVASHEADDNELAIRASGEGTAPLDFGDAPPPYRVMLTNDGARHVIAGPTLGALRDSEGDGSHSVDASADGADEDGVTFGTVQVGAVDAVVTVDVQGGPAELDAWIDFNGDGSWGGVGEQIFDSRPLNAGVHPLTFDVPHDAIAGTVVARFRLSTAGGLTTVGEAADGEVEDHLVTIVAPAASGNFVDSGQRIGGTAASAGVRLGDLDGDGDLDAFVANLSNQGNKVWLNDGNGTFTDSGQSLGSSTSRDVGLGDLDGDGDLDAYVANDHLSLQPDRVWLNDGTGAFTDSGQALSNNRSHRVTLGDVDEDGDLDAFTAGLFGPKLFLNDGGGTFTDAGQSFTLSNSGEVALADLDDDGDLDAFIAYFGPNEVWLNDGSGTFTNTGQSLGNTGSGGVALADLDDDGDLDAFVGNIRAGFPSTPQPNRVWMNDGDGIFTDSGQALGATFTNAVRLGDLDGDGDIDAVSADQTSSVWLNDAAGIFVDSGQALPGSSVFGAALGDLDADGDLDAFFASQHAANTVALNGPSAPEIAVSGNGQGIANGDDMPTALQHTLFSETEVHTGLAARTYTIRNDGATALNLGANAITLSGMHAADYFVAKQPDATVAPGGDTTFIVMFDPAAAGVRNAKVNIANDDSDESPYGFDIRGTATAHPGESSIFADGFESGDAAFWSFLLDIATVDAAAALDGDGFGLRLDYDGTTFQGHVGDQTPNGEEFFRASFLFDPNSTTLPAGVVEEIFQTRRLIAGVPKVYELVARLEGGDYQVEARLFDNGGGSISTGFQDLLDGINIIEVSWESGAPGNLSLLVNGAQAGPTIVATNDQLVIDQVRLGSQPFNNSTIDGAFYLDHFSSAGVGTIDFGDAPTAALAGGGTFLNDYPVTLAQDGARHVGVGPTLGAQRDSERDGQPSSDAGAAAADGDDGKGLDDEDGIVFNNAVAALSSGAGTGQVQVDLQNADPTRNLLNGWIDFNRDGDWDDPDEQIFTDFSLGTTDGVQVLNFSIPQDIGPNVLSGTSFARFRLDTVGGLQPTGAASDGEVEDVMVDLLDDCSLTVTNVADSGNGSLRHELRCANALPGLQTIDFNIAGPGPHTIQPLSALPTITDPVVIDGTTEPGFLDSPVIEIDGSHAGAEVHGLRIDSGSSTVRGLAVNRFSFSGIVLAFGGGNTIQQNMVGTDPTGMSALGNNSHGIVIFGSDNNVIGGDAANERNVVAGNNLHGMLITRAGATGNVVRGNHIGVASDGVTPLGNGRAGVRIDRGASGNTLGGDLPGEGNLIAHQAAQGVAVVDSSTGNAVRRNAIFSNAGLAIDLNQDGITPNDVAVGREDIDTGPNQLQNTPVLTAAKLRGTELRVAFEIPSAADNSEFPVTVELFASDAVGQGGKTFLAAETVAVPGSHTAVIDVAGVTLPGGSRIVATATDLAGNTSEFSTPYSVCSIGVTITADSGFGSLRDAIECANLHPDTDTITFDIPGTGPHTIQPLSPLPVVSQPVIIDGTSEPDFSLTPVIEIDGSNAGAAVHGLRIDSGGSTVRGLAVNRFSFSGIVLVSGGGNTLQQNVVGTDSLGASAFGNNSHGIVVFDSPNNLIGGPGPDDGNVISGNGVHGLLVTRAGSTGNVVQGNLIGVARDGVSPLGNGRIGVRVDRGAIGNVIGGTLPTEGNVIAHQAHGVAIVGNSTGNAIRRNAISSNAGLGIDLALDGPTANDTIGGIEDIDIGPNDQQNTPTVATAVLVGTDLELSYAVESGVANSAYPLTVEFFLADAGGEGAVFLGSDSYSAAGALASAAVMLDVSGQGLSGSSVIVATATDTSGNTSEFSTPVNVSLPLRAVGEDSSRHADRELNSDSSAIRQQERQTLAAGMPAIIDAAIERWQLAGITAADRELLNQVDIAFAELGGDYLGLATGTTIRLSTDAAGFGWYVDRMPGTDIEFEAPGSSVASRMDLLTAVMHEMGHVLGFSDLLEDGLAEDMMFGWLHVGERRSP